MEIYKKFTTIVTIKSWIGTRMSIIFQFLKSIIELSSQSFPLKLLAWMGKPIYIWKPKREVETIIP